MTDTLELGKILNTRYKVIGVLGRGGMSNVYLVEDDKLHSRWALKEMLDIFPDEEKLEIIERFKKEARILAKMKHSNLPRVFDYFEESGRHYLVMEYIEGLTLEEVFEKNPQLSITKILDWSIQICDVLETLHGEGIIYRDLKPSNVMIDQNNRVYIIDFGIARLFSGNKIHDTVIIGTPGFASPEHHGTAETDFRSDIFSLGATMHYLLTRKDPGIIPFAFEEPAAINKDIPDSLSNVVMKALALKPKERFQSAGGMRELLLRISNKELKPGTGATLSLSAKTSGTTLSSHGSDQPDPIEFRGIQIFLVDHIKSYIYPAAISGAMVFLTAWLLGGFSPSLLPFAMGAWIPSAYIVRRAGEYIFRLPMMLKIRLSREGVQFSLQTRSVMVSWSDITGLLVFRERSRVGLLVTKYRISTKKGDFEYSGEMENINRLNDLFIVHAGLKLVGESGGYRRYSR